MVVGNRFMGDVGVSWRICYGW